ncbi:MG2 domain-containing protein [Granulicella rosea]|nr:MG2 domain-containing protein [Granulicella rosea]
MAAASALAGCAVAQGTAFTADEAAARLSFPAGRFLLELPLLHAAGQATLAVELVDPADEVRSRASGACIPAAGHMLCRIELPPATYEGGDGDTLETDLPFFRIRYTATSAGQRAEGVLSLDHVAPSLYTLYLAAPEKIRPGAEYVARVRAVNPLTHQPLANVALEAVLTADYVGDERIDEEFARLPIRTDERGFASVRFSVPPGADLESIDLEVAGRVGNLRVGVIQTLHVPENRRFELTTDKPLYQPGQTIHARMLLLDRNAHASPGQTVKVDVRDPDNTLVYRATAVTSAFGIATIDWQAPSRLRLGEYRLEATLPEGEQAGRSASATVRLSRYDLPTFVVTSKPDRTFYLPGSNAVVDVRADYLFGKPVLHGHVRVVQESERTWNFAQQRYDTKEAKAVAGELDGHGGFEAHIDLSADERDYRDDRRNATDDLHFAAYVTDASTGSTEQRRFDLRLAARALHPYLSGASGVRGLPERRFVSVTSADGTPTECDADLLLLPQEAEKQSNADWLAHAVPLLHLHTDAHGLGRIELPPYAELLRRRPPVPAGDKPTEGDEVNLLLRVRDKAGRTGEAVERLQPSIARLRVQAAHAIYRTGEAVDLTIDSTVDPSQPAMPVTVQLLRHTIHGELLLAERELALTGGHATLSIPSDARYSGLVFVHVLGLGVVPPHFKEFAGDDPATVTDALALLFPRDNALRVDVAMSAPVYQPGEEATAVLSVHGPQDPDGDNTAPAPSALGVVAVDQAVDERQRSDADFGAGDASSFFFGRFLDEPAGAVGGFDLRSLTRLGPGQPIPDGAQLAAEMLLASARVRFETTDNRPSGGLAATFHQLLDAQLKPVRKELAQYLENHTELPTTLPELNALLAGKGVDLAALRDPWGDPYTLVRSAQNTGALQLSLHSLGPDKLPGTGDDFDVQLASWRWFNGRQRQLQHAVTAYHQRTGGYIRTLADLRDEMQREAIDLDRWRDPWDQPFTYRFSIAWKSFQVEALTAGDPAAKPRYEWQRGPFSAGSANIDYTIELTQRVEAALSHYTETHPFPRNEAQLHAAMQAAGISPADLRDPWRHPLYVTFHSRSIFTDQVRTEAHATPDGGPPVVRTIVTPVTAVNDTVTLNSPGPDGGRHTSDDFVYMSLSRIRTTQSARQQTAIRPSHVTIHTGTEGEISGTVNDTAGAIITGVTVVATQIASGAEYEAKSDAQGIYILGPIPAGAYKLRFHLDGFTDLIYDQVLVQPKGTMTLDVAMNVGSVSDAVSVTAEAAMVNTQSGMVVSNATSYVIDGDTVRDLALNGRNYVNLLGVLPGSVSANAGDAMARTSTPRLRDYFPETLLWRPEIVTAPDGTATLRFPVADNITGWRLSAAASTLQGNTGSGATQFQTFQSFFAAFDPPSILTAGDTIALPITLRNYLDHAVTVEGSLTPAPWFHLDGAASRSIRVGSQESASPVFRFTALSPITEARQEFTATGAGAGDRIARPVTVHPDGQESAVTAAAILAPGENTLTFTLPAETLPGSTGATLKLYPNLGAHLRDALAGMAAYPDGCAEQILSIAWPSLLLERYGASLPLRDPKLAQQTHRYLEQAYENLLGNQLASGGFAYWPRDRRADIALTAYAIEFLHQASAYVAVDQKVVERAIAYLAKEQQKDGRWVRTDRLGSQHPEERRGAAMLTASVAAMIAGAPGAEPLLKRAADALQPFVSEFDEPYTLASYALATTALHDTSRSGPALDRLRGLALSENGGAYWTLESNTPFFGWGRAGRVESTAQVLRALLAGGAKPNDDLLVRGMLFLDHERDRRSLWYSTQATARVLDVLAEIALRSPAPVASSGPGSLTVRVDAQAPTSVPLPAPSVDGGPVFVPLPGALDAGAHRVSLTLAGTAQTATAQLIASLYRPWPKLAPASAVQNNEQLRLSVGFSTLHPAHGQAVTANVHLERIGFRGYGMLMAEVGLPPGADVDRASLESALAASGYQLNHYEVLPDRVLLYVWPTAGGLSLSFRFTLRYGVDALTAPSTVYDYYNPDAHFDVAPLRFSSR